MTATSPTTGTIARSRVLPDPRLVEFMVCSTALAGGRVGGRLPLPVPL